MFSLNHRLLCVCVFRQPTTGNILETRSNAVLPFITVSSHRLLWCGSDFVASVKRENRKVDLFDSWCFWGAHVASVRNLNVFLKINSSQSMTSMQRPDRNAPWTVFLPGSCYAWPLCVCALHNKSRAWNVNGLCRLKGWNAQMFPHLSAYLQNRCTPPCYESQHDCVIIQLRKCKHGLCLLLQLGTNGCGNL